MKAGGQDGYSMVDALVAIVILGVASIAIFTTISVSHGALKRSTHRTWATLVGSRIVAERDLGLEMRRQGDVVIPQTGMRYRWDVMDRPATEGEDGRTGLGVGVIWDGPRTSERVIVGGFVDPKSSQ